MLKIFGINWEIMMYSSPMHLKACKQKGWKFVYVCNEREGFLVFI
jgi:hypothetical protein